MMEEVENSGSERAWWRDSWPYLLIVVLATGSFGLIGVLVIGGIVWWLGRWRRVQKVAIWVLIPCLFVTWMVAQNQRRQHLQEVAEAHVEQPEPAPDNGRVHSRAKPSEAQATNPTASRATVIATKASINEAGGDAKSDVPPPAPPTWQQLEWNAEVARFIADFPAVAFPSNAAVFQEKLNLLYSPSKSARKKLEDAYMAAIADRRWLQPPPVDRDAESAKWDKDSSGFVRVHPEIAMGINTAVFQEYLDTLARSNLTNVQMLELAYRESVVDRRWAAGR